MPLLNRFARLLAADFHALLDRAEEPELLLRQAVREMDEELAAMRARAQGLREALARHAQDERAGQARLADLDLELDVCLAAGEDGLARNLVRRKLEAVERLRAGAERRDAASARAAALAATIAQAEIDLDGMRQKLDVLVGDAQHIDTAVGHAPSSAIGTAEIEIALLREKQRRARS